MVGQCIDIKFHPGIQYIRHTFKRNKLLKLIPNWAWRGCVSPARSRRIKEQDNSTLSKVIYSRIKLPSQSSNNSLALNEKDWYWYFYLVFAGNWTLFGLGGCLGIHASSISTHSQVSDTKDKGLNLIVCGQRIGRNEMEIRILKSFCKDVEDRKPDKQTD